MDQNREEVEVEGNDEVESDMLLLLERSKKIVTRTVTSKAEEQAIRDDNFISPAGREVVLN